MLPKELIRKIRRIEISTRSLVESVFSGEYHSVFKGRGMEFDQVREYQEGDDVRSIDWNVTARMNRPFVKEFVEERELVVMLAVDVSGSSDFGTASHFRSEVAAEICSLLALSAIENNDKVGLLLFSDRIEKSVTPRKGRRHVLRVIRELLYTRPEGRGTDLNGALEHLNRTLKRRCVLFLVSDFLDGSIERLLRVTNKRHDVIAVRIVDPREIAIPDVGFLEMEDAETGERLFLSTGNEAFRLAYAERRRRDDARLRSLFRRVGVDLVEVSTEGGYVDPLVEFFRRRARRFGR
ncbi:MAG: DUF58 domain-containing protein [Candidatus Eisenbacteria bacterium]|nr:DUF58 domain-containing protein [Candidatus Eisenbacteria bacterium]